jgi:hypothetical protein
VAWGRTGPKGKDAWIAWDPLRDLDKWGMILQWPQPILMEEQCKPTSILT